MNKKRHYRRFLLLLAMLSAATFANAQNGTKDYKVSGIVPDGINKIYIYKNNGLSSREMLDSVTVTDGRFTMSGTRPAYDLLSLGTTKGVNNIQFFNDGDPLMMDFVNDSLSASPLNERFRRYSKEETRFTDEFYRLFIASRQAKDEAKKKELEQQIAANQEANNEFARTIIHENRDNVIRLQMLRSRQIGKPFCNDVVLLSPDGKQHRLSEWCGQGQYVLIDFWASWCRPCRMEMPNVIQNYERFRDKGLEVLAISIDDKKDAWQRGIKSFGTPFIQLSELQGRKSRLCAIYGISTIPANLLIDPQGKIIAADLRGKSLTRKLESVFK